MAMRVGDNVRIVFVRIEELRVCACHSPVFSARQHIAYMHPSVRLSHGWISQKRFRLGLWNFHLTVALPIWFLRGKFHLEILTGFSREGRQTRTRWENEPFSSFKRQYFEKSSRYVQKWLIEWINMHIFNWHQDRRPRMTLTCYNFEFCRNFARLRGFIWEKTTAKQMKIDPYCHPLNCSPLNVLFSGV